MNWEAVVRDLVNQAEPLCDLLQPHLLAMVKAEKGEDEDGADRS